MKDTQVLIVSPEVKVVLFHSGVELSRSQTNWTHAIKHKFRSCWFPGPISVCVKESST